MKKLCLTILLLLIPCLPNLQAQVDEMMCTPSGVEHIWEGQIGGYVLPSEGTINVLFVFAQFPDDNHDTTNATWVKGQAPANMQGWVDQTWSANPTQGSMTHYFNEMSFDKLKFIGKTVSVITPQTRAWYLANNKKRGDIHTEIIQQLDQTWDFAEFDNWDYEGTYNHINQPDGIVDMVFIVWRNIANDLPNPNQVYIDLNMGRYGDLGFGWPDILVDRGQRRLKMGFWPSGNTPGGSGATLTDWFTEDMFRFCIHEFGHYLQGGNNQHVGFGFWGLLSGWGVKSYVANSFERYRLGWINLNTVQASPNQTIQNATLPNYLTTGVAYRLVIDAATNQYFYIENHQNHTNWKYPNATIENGIYILRQDGSGGDNTFMQCIAADGRFNWTVNQLTPNPWGSGNLPVFKRLTADRVNGYHDLQRIPWTWNGVNQTPHAIHFTENANGQPVLDVRYPGDGKDAFRLGYNEIWSPYSNPNSQRGNKTTTPFGLKLNSLTNGVYSINIYVGTSLNAPPSKPQDLVITVHNTGDNAYPKLNWVLNTEPDVIAASQAYLIERSLNGGAFTQIATVNGTTSQFIDFGVPWAGGGPNSAAYKIRSKDTQGLTSLYSDIKSIQYGNVWKENLSDNEEVITEYKLQQNYPNPFNPFTNILYQLPMSGLVQLKVYDLLGSEIAVLVNEIKSEGSYTVSFDASNLPSGVYIYSLRVNDFVQNNKMTLLK